MSSVTTSEQTLATDESYHLDAPDEFFFNYEKRRFVLDHEPGREYSRGLGYPRLPTTMKILEELQRQGYLTVEIIAYTNPSRSEWYTRTPVYYVRSTREGIDAAEQMERFGLL